MRGMATFLGLDVGTQSVKALLFEPGRGVVARASQPLSSIAGLPLGHSEQAPEDWLEALRIACRSVVRQAAAPAGALAAIGVSGQQHGLVVLDRDGAVIRPAMLWNDTRCAAQCAAITADLGGPARMFATLGIAQLPPGFTAGKIRWLAEHEPANFARAARVLLPHDFANRWLTGNDAMEAGDASGTGLLDVTARCFSAAACDATAPGLLDLLPPLVAPGEPVGHLRSALADELGLPAGLLVSHGGGDNMMAAVGAGAVEPGCAVMSLGTSGTVFAYSAEPVCDPDGEIAAFCDSSGAWLPLGCTMNATVVGNAMRSLSGLGQQDFEGLVASAAPGAAGVLGLPFLTGERSPDAPDASGGFLGLRPDNLTAANLARAAIEGATFALCRLLDRLVELGPAVDELRLTGGGSHSASWRAIVAAAAGRPLRVGIDPDAAALGAAIHAQWTWRRAQGDRELTLAALRRELALDAATVMIEPAPETVELYRHRRAAWQAAVDALLPVFPAIRSR